MRQPCFNEGAKDILRTRNKLGVFGGTFNPIHYGHLRAAEEVREAIGLGKVIFIPSGNPPLKSSDIAPAQDRYEMTRQAIEKNPFFGISDIECKKTGKSYTVETILTLRETYREEEFYLILGIDSFLEMPAWYQPGKLMEITNFVVISRPGYSFSSLYRDIAADEETLSRLDAHTIRMHETSLMGSKKISLLNVTPVDISATGIRKMVKDGKSIKYLLPETAESFIISNKLYLEGSDTFRKQR